MGASATNRFRKTLIAAMLAALLSLSTAGCGSSYGSDPGSNGGDEPPSAIVPDYQTPIKKANDASSLANQKQKEAEDAVKQMEQGP
jgi:hypothetical protein